jgi:hypothetical protein
VILTKTYLSAVWTFGPLGVKREEIIFLYSYFSFAFRKVFPTLLVGLSTMVCKFVIYSVFFIRAIPIILTPFVDVVQCTIDVVLNKNVDLRLG